MRPFAETLYWRTTKAMPPAVAAALDLRRPSFQASWGGPLNGQQHRQRMVREIATAADFRLVVETGTYRGTSTAFFAHVFGKPIETVELMKRFFIYSRNRLAAYPQVTIHLGDSRTFLRDLAGAPEPLFIYLDAHWKTDLPLRDELKIIDDQWKSVVVMIDDFKVPGDSGYAYDDYGPDKQLTASYLPELPGWSIFYPSAASTAETGARRGSCVLSTSDLAERLRGLPSLVEGQVQLFSEAV